MSKRNRGHRVLTWKTQQSWEKPRQPIDCRIHYQRNTTIGEHRGNDLFSPSSPHNGYNEATTSFTLSLSLSLSRCHCVHALYNYLQQKCNNNFTFAQSHMYTHMTFGLFTHMAPRGPQSVGLIITSLRSSDSPKLPIRRDLFPNKLALHSGMGCRVSQYFGQHV